MKKILFDARQELVAFQHQQILKALKDHPEGVHPEDFNKLKYEGVDLSNPKAVSCGNEGWECHNLPYRTW